MVVVIVVMVIMVTTVMVTVILVVASTETHAQAHVCAMQVNSSQSEVGVCMLSGQMKITPVKLPLREIQGFPRLLRIQ